MFIYLRIQVRMQIFSFFGMKRVFEKEIEVFRGWEYAGRHRINLLYLLNLSNVKKVHSVYVFDHFIANNNNSNNIIHILVQMHSAIDARTSCDRAKKEIIIVQKVLAFKLKLNMINNCKHPGRNLYAGTCGCIAYMTAPIKATHIAGAL